MGWVALLLTLMFAQAGGAPSGVPAGSPPELVVQVVDPLWLPMAAIKVVVVAASSGEQQVGRTGPRGFTEFHLVRGAEYSIEVRSPGFKRRLVEHVRIGKSQVSPTAYVQVQLEPRGIGGPAE